jgi:hypothetical protein
MNNRIPSRTEAKSKGFAHCETRLNSLINLTPKELRKAADLQEKIQSLQSELSSILGGEIPIPAKATEAPGKRKFSAAAKARMKAAQKARWAKIKGTAPSAKPAKKRQMSAAAKAALSAAAKARWKKAKAAGKTTL